MSVYLIDFSAALQHLKNGVKVARKAWYPSKEFVFLVPGSTFTVNRPPLLGIYPEGTQIEYHSHLDKRNADGVIVPWVISQEDVLATDWYLVEVI